MRNILSNKKKIRGWKRKLQALKRWRNNNLNLNIDNINENKYDYVKIWIDPFYRLIKREPPDWFKLKILEAFCDIFNSWQNKLIKLEKDYYLKLWLFEPNFINSQIVCAIDERIQHYNNTFDKAEEKKKININKYGNSEFIKSLNFELAIDSYDIDTNDDIYTENEKERFKKKAYKIVDSELGQYYFIKSGYVWIGSK